MQSIDFLQTALGLSDPGLLDQVLSVCERKSVKKGACLIWQDERPTALNFLISGVFRGYLNGVNGSDVTDCFLFECGWPIVANVDMTAPAFVNVEALTDSEIISFPLEQAVLWFQQYPALQNLYHRILIQTTKRFWEQKIVVCQYTAPERYQWFLSAYPGLIDQVKHKQIASFLGITPVTLSRVRSALNRKADDRTAAVPRR